MPKPRRRGRPFTLSLTLSSASATRGSDVTRVRMCTEYWTAKYPDPMVAVPGMGLFYRGPNCHMRTPLGHGMCRMLDGALRSGGEFTFQSLGFGQVVFCIEGLRTGEWTSVHGSGRWNIFMSALVRVQLWVRRRRSRLHLALEFQRSGWGLHLPRDVVAEIVHRCFERRFAPSVGVARVETLSFRGLR